ncbi:MAG: 50S ribosomal protein L17 [Bacteroidetes bacterium]|nr:50S ribosomal protein L17 [Bacteroidota bacterium]
MRHGKTINHLGRKYGHRQALLSNLASSLILHKRINTTVAKAKALRKYVEPLITKSKDDSTHSRRTVFSYLQNKEALKELYKEVANKIGERPGGYTRIIKLEPRLGDNAQMCMMELVDFNAIYTGGKEKAGKAKTRRGRTKKKADAAPEATTE